MSAVSLLSVSPSRGKHTSLCGACLSRVACSHRLAFGYFLSPGDENHPWHRLCEDADVQWGRFLVLRSRAMRVTK